MTGRTTIKKASLAICLFLAVTMSLMAAGEQEGAATGALEDVGFRPTGYPIVDTQVTIEAVIMRPGHLPVPFSEMTLLNDLQEKTNVNIAWEELPQQQVQERVNLMFASREFPDVFFNAAVSDDNIWTAAQGGDIVPLNEYLAYAPNWSRALEENPIIENTITFPDGNIYSLPYSREIAWDYGIRDITLINVDWMDKVGISEMPTTLDELRDILRAFRDGIADGTLPEQGIPWYWRFRNVVGGEFELYGAFGLYTFGPNMLSVDNEEVHFEGTNPRLVDAIEYLNEMYEEELFPEEVFTDPWDTYVSRIQSEPAVNGMHGSFWNYQWSLEQGIYEALPPLPAPGTDRPVYRSQPVRLQKNQFTLMTQFEYPEVALRFIDEFADPLTALQMSYGRVGHEILEEGDGYRQVGTNNQYLQHSPHNFIAAFIPASMAQQVAWDSPQAAARNRYAEEVYGPYTWPQDRHYPNVRFTDGEQEELSILNTEIIDYMEATHADWIVNGGARGGWDSYIDELEDLGLERWLEIHQAALDRFYGN